jgi:large subunit ribosomal protein L22
MKYNYAFKSDAQNTVKIVGRDISISTKIAIEMCSFIRNKPVAKVKAMLEKIKDKKMALPIRRFTEGAGHKTGIGSGKFPYNASCEFIELLESLEANAQNKGLSSSLMIIHACAQKAATPFHYGRKRRIRTKRSHVELAAKEMEPVGKKEHAKDSKGGDSKDGKQTKTQINPVAKHEPKQKTTINKTPSNNPQQSSQQNSAEAKL